MKVLVRSLLAAGMAWSAFGLGLPALAVASSEEWPDDAWIMASSEGGGDGLHLAVSGDGKAWRDLKQVFIKPSVGGGLMRDPQLLRGPDGIFRLVWSTGPKGQGIAYASSVDLVNWSPQKSLPLPKGQPGGGTAMAPEIIYNQPGGEYFISWTSDSKGQRSYRVATKDFETFSKPQLLSGSGTGRTAAARKVLWVPPWFVKELESGKAQAQAGAAPAKPIPAPPPALEGFTADPSIRVFGDTYYLYPTSDKPHWQTTDFSVWSSKNLVDWKKERMVLDVTRDLKWANIEAWAPDAIERNGSYYFYFCAHGEIGVAKAASPLGPFVDALGAPLLRKGTGIDSNTIDPYPFIDDDGQAYLYYGNGRLGNVYKLKPDMVTLDGPPQAIELKDFREGIVVFKRGGKYYFMWSIDDARSPDYRVGWGVADSPLGPVTSKADQFIVLQRSGTAVGTAHHSVVNVPGTDRWYVAYHRHALPEGGGYQRQTVLARMEFDNAGNIQPMDPLSAAFKPGDVGEPVVNGKGLPGR
ncbi:family 43 glycosylhydrolase [Pseudoduganella sp. LjRoot289]|uniref:family 43 glycosylhydrolase n=1 Tax=Pseudoduganella sp. LjRoot289 TaxID=3342314 RepID=UPI003ECFE8CB